MSLHYHRFVYVFLVLQLSIFVCQSEDNVNSKESALWSWRCEQGKCVKMLTRPEELDVAISLPACQLFCDKNSVVWPTVTDKLQLGNYLLHLNLNSMDVATSRPDTAADALFKEAAKRFRKHIAINQPKDTVLKPGGRSFTITAFIHEPDNVELTLETSEKYRLHVEELGDGRLNGSIFAENYFGARHGLETLSQLIVYDDIRNELQVVRDVEIIDQPVYPYRGVLLDTARNYFSVESLKRTIDAMAMSKLNSFHWHITDTQSFPFVSRKRPELATLGAYTKRKIYTPQDVQSIVAYAKIRGVRVIPEFDAPAHVGEGWQNTDFVECFKAEPWHQVCVEPPCGQFNPTKEKLYDYLEDIYSEMLDLFQSDLFHMGGDEVSITCWNQTASIVRWMREEKGWQVRETDFMELWGHFQTEALGRLSKHSKGKNMPIIMWTSTLTDAQYIEKYLPRDKYIIQVWTTSTDKAIKNLLDKQYRLILSNYDALYLDCGFSAWVGSGNNWCSPYIGWQKVYDNSPRLIAENKVQLILGAEAALWSEQADEHALDNRLWPRAAALGERLWTEPTTGWENAEIRMLIHRQRLVDRGISADTIEPEWCIQNQGSCYR